MMAIIYRLKEMYSIKKKKIEDEKRTLREHQNHLVLIDKELDEKRKLHSLITLHNSYF